MQICGKSGSILNFVQWILIASILGSLSFVGIIFSTWDKDVDEILSLEDSIRPYRGSKSDVLSSSKKFSDYARTFDKRDVFGSPYQRKIVEESAILEPETVVESEPVVVRRENLPDHLKVVAVLVGKGAEVVLEDTTTQQTIFLKEGEQKEDLRLEQVLKDRILVEYQGDSIEVLLER